MIVNTDSLEQIDNHWAVKALDSELQKGQKIAENLIVKNAVGNQIYLGGESSQYEQEIINRLSMAYEMVAIEGLNAVLRPTSSNDELLKQCTAGCWKAFEFRRLMHIPTEKTDKILHILHVSALAYCGDRWSDLRRWYYENNDFTNVGIDQDMTWDMRLLITLYECWLRLFRKNGWKDLNDISSIIGKLREDQKTFESGALNNSSQTHGRVMALRLIGLYHWAKATELLALYMLQGEPNDITTQLDKHFESGVEAANISKDSQLEVLLRWLHAASKQMVSGSLWSLARAGNSRVTQFVKNAISNQALFELLPPQRIAIQEQGLLDPAATAVVVEMPTSGGKTLLAQFKILQALNQFNFESGWVAYVTPTRALTSQITRRLRRDFSPLGIQVEQLTGAIEVDAFEEDMLSGLGSERPFDVLVATPEKLQLIIRNNKISRPLALVIMDEAHNIEDETRGLRIELLLASIKRECKSANFLLLMPYVEKAEVLARWLAHDVNAARTISLGSTPWKPNERIVGMYHTVPDDSVRAGWRLKYKTLVTSPKTIHLDGEHYVGEVKPIKIPKSKMTSLSLQTAAMATIMSGRGTSIAVANNINSVWNMARKICETLPILSQIPEEIELVCKFIQTEVSADFELVDMLSRGVGVHHAGLSDEIRSCIEWLAEEGKLLVLCATSTIAQGINFPVSSVFLASRFVPLGRRSKEMSPRDFWNLAGRAGRMGQDSVGVVGIAAGDKPADIVNYVSRATGEIVSQLVTMMNDLEEAGKLNQLSMIIQDEQWEDFRCFIAHLWNEKNNLELVLAETEQLLRNTLGYEVLRSSADGDKKARYLLEATKDYAKKLSSNPGNTALADMTGFSPEGVGRALAGMNQLENKLTASDWSPESLFGTGTALADLYGIMLRVPQLANSLEDIGGEGHEKKLLAEITHAWTNGMSIKDIAIQFFKGDQTSSITEACRAIYRNLVNAGTWGISALSRMSGIDFETLSEAERRKINVIPAMIYHGVSTEEAVLMRMNSVPRSMAENLGKEFRGNMKTKEKAPDVGEARKFLQRLEESDWEKLRPKESYLSGKEYKSVWELLSGGEI
ncbi:hypothetical protein TCA2_4023 [Paenibacillus sp. TCA20]|uniref:DEAD/DEAH box helicase n=1 Tax=Paenibacillus urinalis TaxID=521520 RepID=A0AAX3MYG7_9BACL|nr:MULTISPECIES: DEAD/DEAH box helicase [Paenibacillus]WDH82640.1 DEAD/DEAH box helicase [Paenibacillus urinalis]GAK41532.1 hypothetical protein TCA2_4023 [Paenibacillus sp. TCA20]